MKKSTIIFLTLIYLVFSTGLKVNAHYCADKLQSIDFSIPKTCNKCGKKPTKGCCKDVSKFLQDDDHSKNDLKTSIKAPTFLDLTSSNYIDVIFDQLVSNHLVNKISFFPLDTSKVHKQPVYILNCSFLI